MERYNTEIIEVLVDEFADDKELLANIMFYLANTTTDKNHMKADCEYVLSQLGFCTQCGQKKVVYEYEERHAELDYNNIEVMTEEICPKCKF